MKGLDMPDCKMCCRFDECGLFDLETEPRFEEFISQFKQVGPEEPLLCPEHQQWMTDCINRSQFE